MQCRVHVLSSRGLEPEVVGGFQVKLVTSTTCGWTTYALRILQT